MLSSLEYEPFLVMVSNHDAEWSRQDYEGGDTWQKKYIREAERLRDDCQKWANGIRKYHREFLHANLRAAEVAPAEELRSCLYDPLFYLPLGHSDILSFVLLDDFEPVQHLTARMRTTLESTCLAFAPKLSSLGVPTGHQTFLDLPNIWELRSGEGNKLPPMLLFCRLKLDGLASLGLGLSVQTAAMRAMIARTLKIVSALRHSFKNPELDGMRHGMTLLDVDTMRCSLLDLQGCEEIGLLIFCRNVSAACSVVAGIRALTYGDAFDAEAGLLEQLERSKIHRKLVRHAVAEGVIQRNDDSVQALADNHLFKWSGSALGVRLTWSDRGQPESFLPRQEEFTGYVQATTRFQIAPGHFGQIGGLASGPVHSDAQNPEEFYGESRRYLVGLYDTELQHHPSGFAEGAAPIVETASVIRNLDKMLQRLCCAPEATLNRGRHVVDFETDLIVPVPRLTDEKGVSLFCERVGQGHFAPLLVVLPKLISRVCYSSDCKGQPTGSLDIETMVNALRRLGAPVPLRRTIEYLYRNFAIVTVDPFSFDVLLDLYDTLATLHAGITGEDPANLGRCESSDGDKGRPLLDEEKVRNLASLAEALHNAMMHRTSNAFHGAEWRDMAVDFRGGLNQILFATDAPLKCGLGVLRRFASRKERARNTPNQRSTRNKVGCLIRIGMTPGVRCHPTRLGIEDRARLAFFDADVPHILHVASYADYLHEAFHLVFQAVVADGGRFSAVLDSLDPPEQHRLEEVFALALWKIFVFGSDKKAFAYHWMLSFSRDMLSGGTSDPATWRKFVEVLIQVFLASECWEDRQGDPRFWNDIREMPLKEVEPRFMAFADEVGPFFSEFDRLWQRDRKKPAWKFTEYALTEFRDVYVRAMGELPDVWKETHRIYRDTVAETFPGEDKATVSQMVTQIESLVDIGLENGNPLIWSQYRPPEGGLASPRRGGAEETELRNLQGGGLDPLQFVCKILYRYIHRITEAQGKDIHLLRDSIENNLHFESRSNWWEFQSDKGAAALFCFVPSLRQKRLRKQIVVIKSFWDLASELRARRLLEMLELAGLPEGEQSSP